MFVGVGKPDWSPVLKRISKELSNGVAMDNSKLRFEVVGLTADMPAKASIMNI